MELTLRQVDQAVAALKPFLENIECKNARLVYRLGRNMDHLEAELARATKERDRIANSYKEKNKDGSFKTVPADPEQPDGPQRFVFQPGGEEKVKEELEALNNERVKVDLFTIPVSWLNGVMGKQGPMMARAGFMFEEDEVHAESD